MIETRPQLLRSQPSFLADSLLCGVGPGTLDGYSTANPQSHWTRKTSPTDLYLRLTGKPRA